MCGAWVAALKSTSVGGENTWCRVQQGYRVRGGPRGQTALSTQRDEHMVAMMECLLSPGGVASTSSDHRPASSETPPKLNPASTPAPFLTSSASLRDFTAWKMKFDGYMLLTHADKLPQKEQ
ncbi:hypothetical protein Pcinc_009237 [Petrolisthes cinctipes]|uniref:Uncharacterized protein n=1 Tax=Petrolisthes cinctipes TaxID=88211 RepID=A0AAE1G507_PETCI|nr:hypothetical protein Pcinc_009237 [Petrolisthes cinctipes]